PMCHPRSAPSTQPSRKLTRFGTSHDVRSSRNAAMSYVADRVRSAPRSGHQSWRILIPFCTKLRSLHKNSVVPGLNVQSPHRGKGWIEGMVSPQRMIRPATPADIDDIARVFRLSKETAMPFLPVLHTPEEDRAFFRTRVFLICKIWVTED